jgi:hypothetical protein
MIVKIYGLVDVMCAIILMALDVPVIGKLKWLLIAILLIKGIPSILAGPD